MWVMGVRAWYHSCPARFSYSLLQAPLLPNDSVLVACSQPTCTTLTILAAVVFCPNPRVTYLSRTNRCKLPINRFSNLSQGRPKASVTSTRCQICSLCKSHGSKTILPPNPASIGKTHGLVSLSHLCKDSIKTLSSISRRQVWGRRARTMGEARMQISTNLITWSSIWTNSPVRVRAQKALFLK